eukprot:CAMPEP_0183348036 /NCGR_PEP_ID=MMETSP0164_2-20130417/12688_1 /TAXON_ID=221442 /ORGANISM="Coccolithus pelagicus ssp braarudi, Strain PLY182g" /LENGTH=43 /DNA_ID= /DNA_START= /DNA_END= /DNA_ORIENTATION=
MDDEHGQLELGERLDKLCVAELGRRLDCTLGQGLARGASAAGL